MTDIKVIEGLEPWEVMKRASEGELCARLAKDGSSEDWMEFGGTFWNLPSYHYAIIDTSTPEIDWDGFDWDFFRQYMGVYVVKTDNADYGRKMFADDATDNTLGLRESPFYYWSGGEQPVPDNVEVEIVLRDGRVSVFAAEGCGWNKKKGFAENNIIAFKLTGRVL